MGSILLTWINLVMILFANLSFGLSLVGISPRNLARKILAISVITSTLFTALYQLFNLDLFWGMYLFLLPLVIHYLKRPVLQALMAVSLGMTLDLTFVKLFEYNFFELMLTSNDIEQDVVMELVITLFVVMNQILLVIFIYQKEPNLFQNELFYGAVKLDEQAVIFRPHLLFSALIILSMNVFLYFSYMERTFITANFRIFLTVWGLFTCGLILFFLRKTLIYKLDQSRFYLDQQYQKEAQSFFNAIRSQRHDFNFHLNSIYGLIKSGKYEESSTYIEDVVKNVQKVNELLPLKHPATSALLNTLSGLAQSKGITIRFHIRDDLADMPCSIYDTNKILGNLIQNAMEAMEENSAENRIIEVEIAKERDQIVIQVENLTNLQVEQLEHIFTTGFSTKTLHEGIGLAEIERIISRYRGIIFPELEGSKIAMNVRIPIVD